jgi:methanogenic corrinoid protein MtbC1
MMLTLLLRARGWDVLDLGNSVPAGRVPEAVAAFRPRLAAFSAARAESVKELLVTMSAIGERMTEPPVIVFGGEAFSDLQCVDPVPGSVLPDDLQARLAMIERLHAQTPVPC